MYVLNLNRSPEKGEFWVRADPSSRAQATQEARKGERQLSPRGLSQHRAVQRHASNQASDEQTLGEIAAMAPRV